MAPLKFGLYDLLVSAVNDVELKREGIRAEFCPNEDVDPDHTAFAQHIEHLLLRLLQSVPSKTQEKIKKEVLDNLVSSTMNHLGHEEAKSFALANPTRRLISIQNNMPH